MKVAKRIIQAVAVVVVYPCAVLCAFGRSSGGYQFFAQALALVPGLIGSYLRCAFYRLTLLQCAKDVTISFGTYFSQREARVAPNVSIGSFCVIGRAAIGEATQISSNVQITSGRHEHRRDASGRLGDGVSEQVTIGAHCWIGASATIMAHIGPHATIGAGAVVVKDIAAGAVAVGNPARVLKAAAADGMNTGK